MVQGIVLLKLVVDIICPKQCSNVISSRNCSYVFYPWYCSYDICSRYCSNIICSSREPLLKGKAHLLDLLVLTTLDQLFFKSKILIAFVTKQATLMSRSTLQRLPLHLVCRGLRYGFNYIFPVYCSNIGSRYCCKCHLSRVLL